MRNEEVLQEDGRGRKLTVVNRKRNASWLGHILRRNCLQKRIIEENRIRWRREVGMLEVFKKEKKLHADERRRTSRGKMEIV